jgi:hypothetical protein
MCSMLNILGIFPSVPGIMIQVSVEAEANGGYLEEDQARKREGVYVVIWMLTTTNNYVSYCLNLRNDWIDFESKLRGANQRSSKYFLGRNGIVYVAMISE